MAKDEFLTWREAWESQVRRDAELIPIGDAVQALDLTARTALDEMRRLPARMGPAKAETAREVAVAAEKIEAALAATCEALRTGQGLDQD